MHHDHEHEHNHEHCCHDHDHDHCDHHHDHEHCHDHHHDHDHEHSHCGCCHHEHTPMEELTALMEYMVKHNGAHAKELADLAKQFDEAGNHMAYEQVMAAVSDFEKGNMRLSMVLLSLG